VIDVQNVIRPIVYGVLTTHYLFQETLVVVSLDILMEECVKNVATFALNVLQIPVQYAMTQIKWKSKGTIAFVSMECILIVKIVRIVRLIALDAIILQAVTSVLIQVWNNKAVVVCVLQEAISIMKHVLIAVKEIIQMDTVANHVDIIAKFVMMKEFVKFAWMKTQWKLIAQTANVFMLLMTLEMTPVFIVTIYVEFVMQLTVWDV